MFAYCGNNPASNIDPAGTYYCQVRDNRAVVGGVVSADDLLGLAAGIGIYNLFDEITEKLEKSIAKAKTNKKYRSATETHHIAAKKSYRAAEAKAILTEVLPNGVENPENKIELKTVVHRRIHTNLYYALVNSLVVDAYN